MTSDYNKYSILCCRETFNLLCTLTRLELRFKCPIKRVVRLSMKNGHLQDADDVTYRPSDD